MNKNILKRDIYCPEGSGDGCCEEQSIYIQPLDDFVCCDETAVGATKDWDCIYQNGDEFTGCPSGAFVKRETTGTWDKLYGCCSSDEFFDGYECRSFPDNANCEGVDVKCNVGTWDTFWNECK